uniref:probable S-adenosylmethionine-dependent methyltransferase CRG1 n=1 Tax=Styela clava TaxID=7725 RepID=UPI00193A93BA|nr:probable S-adenosylmethionine-dependent methyltransferase CRG1 [Styela clava]
MYVRKNLVQLLQKASGFPILRRNIMRNPEHNRLYERDELAINYSKLCPSYPTKLTDDIIEHLANKQGRINKSRQFERMLDLGCGIGLSTKIFAPYFESILGVDLSESQIHLAIWSNRDRNVAYKIINDHVLPVKNNSIDLLTCASSLQCLDLQKFEKECDRVLKSDGCCAVYTTNYKSIKNADIDDNGSERHRVFLRDIVLKYFSDIDAHPRNVAALDGNLPIYEQLKTQNKEWLQSIYYERNMSLNQFKDIFRSYGDYEILIKKRRSSVDPVETLGENIKIALNMEDIKDEDIKVCVEFEYPIFVFGKNMT